MYNGTALRVRISSFLSRKTYKLKLQNCDVNCLPVFLFDYLSENTLIRTKVLASEYSDPYRVRQCDLGRTVFMLVFNIKT